MQFNLATMLAQAERVTELADWGDDDFREPLAVLLDSLNNEARLSDIGCERTESHIHNTLCQRLRMIEDRKRRPQIAAQIVDRPLFMTGLPRSGTSFLNAMVAANPANLAPLHWQMWCPSPPPNDPALDHSAQIALARRLLDFQGFTAPEMKERHHYDAMNAEESGHLCEFSFLSTDFPAFWDVPAYAAYLYSHDYRLAYRWHKFGLQALQIGTQGRRWALKAPEHMYHLRELLDVFPDAILVMNHRDPSKVMASVLSMVAVHRDYFGNRPLKFDRTQALDFMEPMVLALEQVMRMREDPAIERRFIDIAYLDLERDPLREVARVHAHMGMTFDEAAREAARRHHAANRKGQFGKHRYLLSEYGLTQQEVHERLQSYIRRFNVELEDGS